MTTQDTRTLLLLLERAQADRDAALTACQRAEQAAARQRTQAEQLQTYRGEYQQRWSVQFGREGRPEIVQCYRSFMTRLEEAVQQQAHLLGHADGQLAVMRETLQVQERRVAAVRKLIERRLAEQQALTSRRDQRETDESAQRASQHAKARLETN